MSTKKDGWDTLTKVILGVVIGLGLSYAGLGYWYNASGQAAKNHPQQATTQTQHTAQQQPSPPPPPPEVVNMPDPFVVQPGGSAWLSAGTLAGSSCSIVVEYLSGPSHAQGLYPKTADNTGQVRWDWFIGTNTTPGNWPVTVTCSLNGQTTSNHTYIYVRD